MSDTGLENALRRHREKLGLSQQALADLAGVTRHAIIAIERGRQVPSTALGLRLARALECSVESLFWLRPDDALDVRLAESPLDTAGPRVALGSVDGTWTAHRLPLDPTVPADGLLLSESGGGTATVQPLTSLDHIRQTVLVSGCAPLLGSLAQRVSGRFSDAHCTWIPANSQRSVELLAAGLVHIAGLHGSDSGSGDANIEAVRARMPDERMLLVNLTRWREGFVVPAGNPKGIVSADDLLHPGVTFARREEGSGAHKLLLGLRESAGAGDTALTGPLATAHTEVAQLVRSGAADVGIAIESVALAAGLGFVPLAEERFDLVMRAELAGEPPVSRVVETLADPSFRAEVEQLPGYDAGLSGHVTVLEAA